MSVKSLISSIKEKLTINSSHWLKITNNSFPKYVKYELGKLPIIPNCKYIMSNKNNNSTMIIIMKNETTNEECKYKLILRKTEDENVSVKNMLSYLTTILTNYNKLKKENEENKKKVQELETKVQELETFQAVEEVVL
jgi:hypothetical protein